MWDRVASAAASAVPGLFRPGGFAGGGGPALSLLLADPLTEGAEQLGFAERRLEVQEANNFGGGQHGEGTADWALLVLPLSQQGETELLAVPAPDLRDLHGGEDAHAVQDAAADF